MRSARTLVTELVESSSNSSSGNKKVGGRYGGDLHIVKKMNKVLNEFRSSDEGNEGCNPLQTAINKIEMP
jgi:hypothetical protein